jgi:hypothetical protein
LVRHLLQRRLPIASDRQRAAEDTKFDHLLAEVDERIKRQEAYFAPIAPLGSFRKLVCCGEDVDLGQDRGIRELGEADRGVLSSIERLLPGAHLKAGEFRPRCPRCSTQHVVRLASVFATIGTQAAFRHIPLPPAPEPPPKSSFAVAITEEVMEAGGLSLPCSPGDNSRPPGEGGATQEDPFLTLLERLDQDREPLSDPSRQPLPPPGVDPAGQPSSAQAERRQRLQEELRRVKMPGPESSESGWPEIVQVLNKTSSPDDITPTDHASSLDDHFLKLLDEADAREP